MQTVADVFGGNVLRNKADELGFRNVNVDTQCKLFRNLPSDFLTYQSHRDIVERLPEGAEIIARNENCIQGFILDNFYCVQFHPEITPETAVRMANRDGRDVGKILKGVDGKYDLPQKVILNFINSYK